VHTVGHGARPVGALIAVLTAARVAVLVDIRRHPGSRRHPQFNRGALAAALETAGSGYEWQGAALGGRRSRVPGSRHTAPPGAALAGYADHMDTAEFRQAVDALAGRQDIAVMCAETSWRDCHRSLVADALTMRGAEVVHLLDVGRAEAHRLSPTVRRGPDGWPVYDTPDTIPGIS
jgi:uncharacterized protein (DUF488 family)